MVPRLFDFFDLLKILAYICRDSNFCKLSSCMGEWILGKKSISRTFFSYMVLILFISIGTIGIIWITQGIISGTKRIDDYKKQYFKINKDNLNTQVNDVIDLINYKTTFSEQLVKDKIIDRVEQAHAIATNLYEQWHSKKSEKEIKKMITDALRPIRYDENRGYVFIATLDGYDVLYPTFPEMEGKYIYNLQDDKGNYIVQNEIKTIKKSDHGFVTGFWKKPNSSEDKFFTKVSYLMRFSPYNWYIGSGEYLDSFTDKLKNEVLHRCENQNYPKDGFITIHTFDGTCLSHYNKKLIGKNRWDHVDANGIHVLEELYDLGNNETGGFLEYIGSIKPSTGQSARKLVFVKNYEPWNWIISYGVFLDDLENQISLQKKESARNIGWFVVQILLLFVGFLIVIYVIVNFITQKLQKNTETFLSFFADNKQENKKIETLNLHFKEFEVIAESANRMIEDRTVSIRNLIKRDTLLNAISKANKLLIEHENIKANIKAALKMIGEAVGVDRVYIFQNFEKNGKHYMKQIFEISEKATPQINNDVLQHLGYEDGFSRWFETLKEGKEIIGLVRSFPKSEREILQKQNILSILVVPLLIDDSFWGFIGFDDCHNERSWEQVEISILKTIASSFGSVIIREKISQELSDSEELFRSLTEHLRSAVYTFDETGKFCYCNPEALRISEYSEKEIFDMNFFDFVHPDFVELVKERGFSRLRGDATIGTYDFKVITKYGNEKWVKVSNSKIKLMSKTYILGTAYDITQRKNAEAALFREKKQLAITLRSIGDGVITTDLDSKIVLLNKTGEKLTGWKQDEVVGKDLLEVFKIVDEKDGEAIENPVAKVLETQQTVSLSNHTILIQKSGKKISISDSAAPIRDENDNIIGVVLVFRDVTAQKHTQLVQNTLLKIAEALNRSNTLTQLYKKIHEELNNVINSKNFYIALLEEKQDIIKLPYFVDEKDYYEVLPAGKSLTAYVIKNNTPLLVTKKEILDMAEKGLINHHGSIASVWLGVPLRLRNKTIGAVVVQNYDYEHYYVKDDQVLLEFISDHIAMAIEKKKVEKSILESEEKYRLLFEAGNDSIILLQNDTCIDCNQKALEQFKVTDENLIGQTLWGISSSEDEQSEYNEKVLDDYIDAAFEGEAQFFEWEFKTFEDKIFHAEVGLNPFEWKNRYYLLVIIRDITERKKRENQINASLKEKEILLQEIHHRVKNNMQIISSMLSLQFATVNDEKTIQMFKDSQNRVKTMALVHEKLYRSSDFANINFYHYVKDLVRHLFISFQVKPDKVYYQIKIEDIFFDISTAISCGLIINELVTNSIKYAFPEDQKGLIIIGLEQKDDHIYELLYQDDGIGLPEEVSIENSKTLGLHLIEILSIQLGGEVVIERKKGVCFKISFKSSDGGY